MLYYLVSVIYVLVCLVLILVVLLQQGKGGDMASAFGGGSSQTAFGARAGATLLTRATTVCAALFMICAIILSIISERGPGSVLSGSTPPAAPASAPAATTPATPATPTPAAPATTTPATPPGAPK
jgi:preprotein translocase subunit SecG